MENKLNSSWRFILIVLIISEEIFCKNTIQCSPMNNSSMLRENIIEELLDNYDKRFPPFYNEDKPVEIKVQMYILSIFDISASDMTFSMSMFLRQKWLDPRLRFNGPKELTKIELDNSIRKEIWVSDLAFMSDINANFHDVTVPNRLMELYPDGQVYYSVRVTGKFACFMELQKFPFDEQICSLEMESYGLTDSIVNFQWADTAIARDDEIKNSQFEIETTESYTCEKTYASGDYSCIGLKLHFKRRYGFYLIQVYAPSTLVVILSWISFWLNMDAIPARISLGILTVLTISSNGNMSVSMSHLVSYVRAIDVWNVVCLILVFSAVIEYAYVCVTVRVYQRRKDENANRQSNIVNIKHKENRYGMEKQEKNGYGMKKNRKETSEDSYQSDREKARRIEKTSRIAFPLVFIVFNIIYWVYYMT